MEQTAYDFSRVKGNYYKILGIDQNASADEVKYLLQKKTILGFEETHFSPHHPSHINYDRIGDVLFAADVLGDEKKRAAYDRYLKEQGYKPTFPARETVAVPPVAKETITKKKAPDQPRKYPLEKRVKEKAIVTNFIAPSMPVASFTYNHPDIRP